MASYWNPIIAYVSERSGVKLQLKIGRTSADTTAFVLAQEVEFVFSNHLFSPERDQLGWKTFGRRQTPPLHSQIVVLADSPIQKLAQLANPRTGRVHTHYAQAVAVTGRLSSNDPNLQNIPIRDERGKEIRKAFIASDENHVLLSADYAQIELRLVRA